MPDIELPDSRTKAPDFPKSFAWVNTDRPLYFDSELKGRIVILDFWTYCCINCMHVLPDLAFIEQKYKGQPVVVIGVHSAKFDNEGDRQNIETACYRYNIEHPVIVDENHRIWTEYGVRAWPTLMVIDPEGKVVGSLSGEGNRATLDAVVAALLREGEQKGTLAEGPPAFMQKGRVPSASGLAFPGKVLADPAGEWLFISDSNHHRIIVANPDGEVRAIAGSGNQGQTDGSFLEAEFNQPQGMAYYADNHLLYVADTENHTIRKLDLKAKTVTTISGTGKQVYDRTGGGVGTAQGLNSPWDLALHENTLYVAMAGPHQIWTLDIETTIAKAWVGSGIENITDGTGTSSAALAQPSGLAIHGEWLYFADSEVSAIRRANLKTREVETLIGTGLFNFGDRIGGFPQSLLQHPLGVAVYKDNILVADTYNHRIKRLDLDVRESSQLTGTGNPDLAEETEQNPSLYEPGGLSVAGDMLYIADTNHDRIIRYDLISGKWSPLDLKGLRVEAARRMDMTQAIETIAAVQPGSKLSFRLSPELPQGVHLNAEAPINWSFREEPDSNNGYEGLIEIGKLPVDIDIKDVNANFNNSYFLTLDFACCTDENRGLCIPATLMWHLRLQEDTAAPARIELTASIEP
ncbi:redoxin domain-containing protein [bacterium]|nr:redoxin domain-containing protein [bacterium]